MPAPGFRQMLTRQRPLPWYLKAMSSSSWTPAATTASVRRPRRVTAVRPPRVPNRGTQAASVHQP